MLVLQDRHQLPRPFGLLDQVGLVGQRVARLPVQGRQGTPGLFQELVHLQPDDLGRGQVAAGVFGGVLELVVPAAGVGAGTLVRIPVVEVTGQQAAARIRHAKGAVNEHFQLHLGTTLAYFLDFIQR